MDYGAETTENAGKSTGKARSRAAVALFIVAWLAVQILVPFVRKFELPGFRYRFATFSWAMFSHEPVRYSVTLFRISDEGRREPIPGIDLVAPGFATPEQQRFDSYRSIKQIQAWYRALIEHVAERAGDGRTYGVSVRWLGGDGVDSGSHWELLVPSAGEP